MSGHATTLLLLPDAGHDGRSWPPAFLDGLGSPGETAWEVLRPDWPSLRDDADVEDLAAAVRDRVDAALPRGGRVHVVGQGLGALVALELALGRRKIVASLTLIGAHCGARTAVASPPWVTRALDDALAIADADETASVPVSVGRPPEVRAGALRALLHAQSFAGPAAPLLDGARVRAHWAIAGTADSYARLPRIAKPTLLIHGSADVVVLAENGRTIADRIPGARFQLLEGGGHCVVQEQPGAVAALVRDFIIALVSSGPRAPVRRAPVRRAPGRADDPRRRSAGR